MENNETEKNTISQVIINEVEKVIAQLHENLYVPYDMPSEIANDPVVIDTERKLGIRAACERGYDVIADKFYVKEKIKKQMRSGAIESVVSVQEFDIFADYFAYLRGEIYSFACYYGYKFSDEELANYSIDMSRLNFESLLDYTINDFTLKPNISELQEYKEAERVRKRIKEWLSKFNNCDTYNKFVKTINKVNQSSFAKKYKDILICEYINNHREEAFPILIQYVNSNWTTSLEGILCLLYDPKADWSKANELQGGFIYLNGHSHKNLFYDDGIYRIYADNQIGYYAKSLMAKYFYVDCTIDIFGRYLDGIYEITADEYRDFYRKKNIRMEYNRSNKLYMIKKNGYYMFINEYENGTLYILNGGAIKKLPINSLEYYYNNIEHVVAIINPPLQKFTEYQTSIAGAVKSFGGSGVIHGAIVDIDFFNHIYVNPIDMTITPYWADDIIHKIVYPSVPALLEDRCPQMFIAYKNLSDSELNKQLILQSKTKCLGKEVYLSTDIYRASNEMKKMQKLIDGILTTWIDPKTGAKEIKFSGD